MSAPIKRHAIGKEGEEHPQKLSTSVHDCDKLSKFIAWANDKKFEINKKVTVGKEGSCAQYGMQAVEDIKEGEVLFQIPRSLLLCPKTSFIADALNKDAESIQGTSGWAPLLIALLHEYNNPESLWRPYLDLVPDFKELDLPMFWPSTEMEALLIGTGVVEAVRKDLDNIETEFKQTVLPFIQKHEDKFSPVCKNLEFYKKMVAFVMAYSFTEQDKQEEEMDEEYEDSGTPPPMMVPMADILNHIAKNNANLKFEKEALKMVATRDIKKGEEIFNTYGELSNFHLLHMYGFAEQFPRNHYDTVEISALSVLEAGKELAVNTEDLLSKKLDLLLELGLTGDEDSFVLGCEGILTEEEMVQTLKVLCMSDSEFEKHVEDEGWEEDDDDDCDHLTFEAISKAPTLWKTILLRCTESSLQRYTTTLEQDEELLKSQTLSTRHKYSLYTQYGQKKLLVKLKDACICK